MNLLAAKPDHHHGAHERVRRGRLGEGNLAGLGHLLRFILRRDRFWLPIWVLGLSALTAYFANAIAVVMDGDSLQAMTAFAKNPVMALITGPGYGLDQVTIPRFIVGMYGVFLMIGAALMSILTVSRHTRAEEQTARAELVRAGVTGRHAQLFAALVLTAIMNVLLSAGMAAAFGFSQAEPEPWSATVLFAVGIGTVGCIFAAVTAVTVQLSAFARAASSMAGAVLALSFVLLGSAICRTCPGVRLTGCRGSHHWGGRSRLRRSPSIAGGRCCIRPACSWSLSSWRWHCSRVVTWVPESSPNGSAGRRQDRCCRRPWVWRCACRHRACSGGR